MMGIHKRPQLVNMAAVGTGPVADLARERARASFPVRALTHLLDGGAAATERKERIYRLVEREPAFDGTQRPFQSRSDRFAAAVAAAKRVQELKRAHRLTEAEVDDLREAVGEILPCVLRPCACAPCLR
jgi:acyl-CoA oxidase